MRLQLEQLNQELAKGLKPVYLLAGDEPLQMNSAADAIRQAARLAGFTEREIFLADTRFNWQDFQHSARSLPLFEDKN